MLSSRYIDFRQFLRIFLMKCFNKEWKFRLKSKMKSSTCSVEQSCEIRHNNSTLAEASGNGLVCQTNDNDWQQSNCRMDREENEAPNERYLRWARNHSNGEPPSILHPNDCIVFHLQSVQPYLMNP